MGVMLEQLLIPPHVLGPPLPPGHPWRTVLRRSYLYRHHKNHTVVLVGDGMFDASFGKGHPAGLSAKFEKYVRRELGPGRVRTAKEHRSSVLEWCVRLDIFISLFVLFVDGGGVSWGG